MAVHDSRRVFGITHEVDEFDADDGIVLFIQHDFKDALDAQRERPTIDYAQSETRLHRQRSLTALT